MFETTNQWTEQRQHIGDYSRSQSRRVGNLGCGEHINYTNHPGHTVLSFWCFTVVAMMAFYVVTHVASCCCCCCCWERSFISRHAGWAHGFNLNVKMQPPRDRMDGNHTKTWSEHCVPLLGHGFPTSLFPWTLPVFVRHHKFLDKSVYWVWICIDYIVWCS